MTSQTPSLQLELGPSARDTGIAKILKRCEPWKLKAMRRLREYRDASPAEFGSDDFRDWCGESVPAPHGANAWGALFNCAAKANLIEQAGFRMSRRTSAHARLIRTWRFKPASAPAV